MSARLQRATTCVSWNCSCGACHRLRSIARTEGALDTYIYVDTIDGLLHYRHDEFPEADALRLMA